MSKIQHFESLSVFMVDFDLWTGQTKLSAEDFKLGAGGQLPPEKLTQLGSKKVINPDHLKAFAAIKAQTIRLMLRHGMKFMNGFAIPVDKTDDICMALDAIGVEFESLKQQLVRDYTNILNEWINENPDHADMIREGALTVQEVEKRIGFEYQVFQISPMASNEALASKMDRKVNSLGNDLIDEITKTATTFFNERFLGQTRVRTSTRQTLTNLRDKIDGLSFLNGALVPLVGLLNQTLDVYNKYASGGAVEAPHFYQIMAVVSILKDADAINAYAQGQVAVDNVAQGLLGQALPGVGVNDAIVQNVLNAQTAPAVTTVTAPAEPIQQIEAKPVVVEATQVVDQPDDAELLEIERFFQQHAAAQQQEMTIEPSTAEVITEPAVTEPSAQPQLSDVPANSQEVTAQEEVPAIETMLDIPASHTGLAPIDEAAAAAFLEDDEPVSLHW
nr:DUF3150 domain-containing protein [Alcaligenes faecalis]